MLLIEQTLIAYMIEYNKMMTFSVIDMDARYLIFFTCIDSCALPADIQIMLLIIRITATMSTSMQFLPKLKLTQMSGN